jgi:hypothetical protein
MQTFMKTILSAVQTWTKGKIKDSTADWNQNDSNTDNYIKNRTHWEENTGSEITLVNNLTSEQYDNGEAPPCTFVVGQKYDIIWCGQLFSQLECMYEGEWRVIGDSNNLPFYIDDDGGNDLYVSSSEEVEDWTLTITTTNVIIHTLDEKYLPDRYTPIDEF